MSKSKKTATTQPKKYDVHRTLPSYSKNEHANLRNSPKIAHNPSTIQSNSVDNHQIETKKRFTWKRAAAVLLFLILVPLLVIAIWDYKNFSEASQKMFGSSNPLELIPGKVQKTGSSTNILIIGYSADDPDHAGALLTDSIMILSMNPDKKTGYTFSVPRDLYVDIPDYGSAKINEAYQAGERSNFSEAGYSSGGIGLLQKIIERDFEITTHYHAIINYGAVRDTVNALDGIDVTIASPDPEGLFDPNFKPEEGGPLKLSNGPQRIDGQTALRLTRARGSTAGSYGFPLSDFNRIQNQQLVLKGIKSGLSASQLIDPRENKPIFDAVAENVQTNVKLSEIIPLYRIFKSIPEGQLKPVNLREENGRNLLGSITTSSGQSALVPSAGIDDFSEIQALIKSLN